MTFTICTLTGGKGHWKSPRLGPKEYLVLGDHVPISTGSREPGKTLQRKHLLEKVLWTWFDEVAAAGLSPALPSIALPFCDFCLTSAMRFSLYFRMSDEDRSSSALHNCSPNRYHA